MGNTQIDQNLFAALYVLGFNFLDGDRVSGEIAKIKGDMTIKLVHLQAHCYRTCPFFDCFCYGLGSSSGQHRFLKDHL